MKSVKIVLLSSSDINRIWQLLLKAQIYYAIGKKGIFCWLETGTKLGSISKLDYDSVDFRIMRQTRQEVTILGVFVKNAECRQKVIDDIRSL